MLPRYQRVGDNLRASEGLSNRIRDMGRVVTGMRPEVDAAIERELGGTFFLDRPTPQRLANWRSKAQGAAAREAGYAYSAYGHQKLSGILDELSTALLLGAGKDVRHEHERILNILWCWADDEKLNHIARNSEGATSEARSEEHTSELQSLMRTSY